MSLSQPVGLKHLVACDKRLKSQIKTFGSATLPRPLKANLRFDTLVRAITHQQLAGNAARAIHGRLLELVGTPATPENILRRRRATLRACGLSGSKIDAIVDLAKKVQSGALPLGNIGRMKDEEIIESLSQVRGIGTWTAEMFLMNAMGRADIWPVDDYGVRVGFQAIFELPNLPKPKELNALGEQFRPYRSLLSWYCWRAADRQKEMSKKT